MIAPWATLKISSFWTMWCGVRSKKIRWCMSGSGGGPPTILQHHRRPSGLYWALSILRILHSLVSGKGQCLAVHDSASISLLHGRCRTHMAQKLVLPIADSAMDDWRTRSHAKTSHCAALQSCGEFWRLIVAFPRIKFLFKGESQGQTINSHPSTTSLAEYKELCQLSRGCMPKGGHDAEVPGWAKELEWVTKKVSCSAQQC